MDAPALPKGWRREEYSRPRGLSSGKNQVHYINELGQRFKNKCMLARFMGGEVDLTPFDWRTGKIDPQLKKKVERVMRLRGSTDVNRRLRNDHTIKPPLRHTLSNFKLPVTIYRAQPKESPPVTAPANSVMTRQVQNQIKQANNHEQQRAALAIAETKSNNLKPRQIFWEKRLQGQHASINDENYEKFNLPGKIKPLLPEYIAEDSVVRAIVTSLFDKINAPTVTGQSSSTQEIKKNPAIFLDPYQPPTQLIVVDDNDLKRQEDRVNRYRRELERVLRQESLNNASSNDEEVMQTDASSSQVEDVTSKAEESNDLDSPEEKESELKTEDATQIKKEVEQGVEAEKETEVETEIKKEIKTDI